jgi:hypothetical protein
VAVHHVHVDQVAPGVADGADLLGQTAEVGGEDTGGYEHIRPFGKGKLTRIITQGTVATWVASETQSLWYFNSNYETKERNRNG